MNGLSSVKADYNRNSNYYLVPNNNVPVRAVKMQEAPQSPDAARTAATAGILQAFALFLHKASEYCGNELMKGQEFTDETSVKKVAENMVKKNKLKDLLQEEKTHFTQTVISLQLHQKANLH